MINEVFKQIPLVDKVAALPVLTVPIWLQYLNGAVALTVGLGTILIVVFRVLSAYQDWVNKKTGSHQSDQS
ncbi:hypothetical protein O4H49_04470 [Kiloniella laminariae]|uniref:Holin n=1 Tax=Kiloniella laminariae TaxID=454162 RepID=A0ABT4LFZ0_9PROT|nr:hypothetical protein [Kiloniella laminariae]MCZ4280019.1 hypothetical protein [Kiloniella laminariae]